jgi:pimeloyl-ACP methyl ester carboxylesterase
VPRRRIDKRTLIAAKQQSGVELRQSCPSFSSLAAKDYRRVHRNMTLANDGFLDIGPSRLEYKMIGPRPNEAATFVLLHEGLGSVGLWGDFPMRLAEATGLGVFAYSRSGYGRSSLSVLPRRVTFMHEEARDVLPRVLDAIFLRRGILLGHSDGASIATIYAGSVADHRIRGLVLLAPHFFTEEFGIAEIARMREAYQTADLRSKLARWHADPDNAFYNWSGPWLEPAFRQWDILEELAYIRVPILIIQGEKDQYGTLRQVEVAKEECCCPVEAVILKGIRHVPHREAPGAATAAIVDFARRLQIE